MADDLTLNAGSGGSTLATDDVTDAGGAHYQRIKLTDGTANSTTHIQAAGGVEANALRVTIASDSTGLLSIDDNGGSLTVDAASLPLPTGAATETTLSTLNAKFVTGTVIGDVNLGATDNAVLDTIATNTTDGATQTTLTALNAKFVTGTVIGDVNLGATDNAVLDTIATNTTDGATQTTLAAINTKLVTGTIIGDVNLVSSIPAGTNGIGKLTANSGVDIGDVDVTSIAAGSNLIGDVGIGVRTSGGTTFFNSIDLDETEEQVKATAGQLYWVTCFNVSAALLYLQVFNATAASVTVGTTAPDMVFPIPTQGDTNGAGFVLSVPNGIAFSTAITVAATTTPTGSTGAGANEVIINLGYN